MTAVRPRRKADRRKLLAIASAFSVLGVGAGVTTLASWTEGVPLAGTAVGASNFCVETSINGASWVQETLSGGVPASIPVSFSAASALSPGTNAYALVQVAMCPGSVAATVSLGGSAANTGSFLTALNYGVSTVATASCTSTSFGTGTSLIPSTTSLTSATQTAIGTAPVNSGTTASPTTPINLCFQVGLPSGSSLSLQNSTGNPAWTLQVQSS